MNSYYNLFVGTENGLLKGNYSKYYLIDLGASRKVVTVFVANYAANGA